MNDGRPQMNLDVGKRHTMEIDGHETIVGLVEILGEWQMAYLPRTQFRYAAGAEIVMDSATYTVVESRQSDRVPRMVVVTLTRE